MQKLHCPMCLKMARLAISNAKRQKVMAIANLTPSNSRSSGSMLSLSPVLVAMRLVSAFFMMPVNGCVASVARSVSG